VGAVPERRASAAGARPAGAHPRSAERGGRSSAGRNLAVVPTGSLVAFQTRLYNNSRFGLGPEVRAFADRLPRILLRNQRAEDENAGVRADVARRRCAAVAQALRIRQRAGTWLAHRTRMAPELSEEERELVQHFTGLPHEDRGRILALIRSLSLCHTVEVYRGSWAATSAWARSIGRASAVITTTGTSRKRGVARTCSQSERPLASGSRRSRQITSGIARSSTAAASAPVAASWTRRPRR